MVLSSEEYCQNPYLFFQNLEVENGPMFCDISDAISELWPEGALKRKHPIGTACRIAP